MSAEEDAVGFELDELRALGYTLTATPDGYDVFYHGKLRWALYSSRPLPLSAVLEAAIYKCFEYVRSNHAGYQRSSTEDVVSDDARAVQHVKHRRHRQRKPLS